ncbi:hypothetical protein AB0D04_11210 [Streptomyces sp. NPDC048483]|uniref:RipA family octameric membrane protein n=1 Tax=Streptomyces sp. NPDC048483 TaxID=3154927 RepID=UPI003442BD3D
MTDPSDVSASMWNDAISPRRQTPYEAELYRNSVLEQYKLCVEMADRISARRSLTNTFFLSLNSLIGAGFVGLGSGHTGRMPVWLLVAGLLILLTQCSAWFALIRSYRQLNAAKFAVIGALEERLPAYAYSRGEWAALGEGKDWRRYLPLTHVEQWVPWIFAAAYLLGSGALAFG